MGDTGGDAVHSLAWDGGSTLYAGCWGGVYRCQIDPPNVWTDPATDVTSTGATLNGEITSTGGENCDQRGFSYRVNGGNWTDLIESGSFATGAYSLSLTGLSPGDQVDYKAKAHNSAGWAEDTTQKFTTDTTPTVTTTEVTNITPTTAESGGNVADDGGEPVTARGVCWSTNPNPTTADDHTTDGTGTGEFTSNITGLTPGTHYHVRAYATNSVGTSYGEDREFITLNPVPSITSILPSSATAGGSAFTLTVNGSDFLPSSVVRWNGNDRTTIYISSTQLTASILSSDIESAGEASVTVFNPAPGGGTSNAKTFNINEPTCPNTFYFAEGYTGRGSFVEYLTVMNPNSSEAHLSMTYMFSNGTTQTQDLTVGATTRATINVNSVVGDDQEVSVKITSDQPVVCERPIYFNYAGSWNGGHCVVGYAP